jgi:hypothetical protein
VLVESNYFENVNRPHFFFDNSSTAIIAINGDNHYVNITNDKDEGQGTCFDPPYDYAPDKGSEVKDIVTKRAGPQFGTVATASRRSDASVGRASDASDLIGKRPSSGPFMINGIVSRQSRSNYRYQTDLGGRMLAADKIDIGTSGHRLSPGIRVIVPDNEPKVIPAK